MNLTEGNFDLVNEWRRGCHQGNETSFLDPSKYCQDQFTIGTGCFNHGKFCANYSINIKYRAFYTNALDIMFMQ